MDLVTGGSGFIGRHVVAELVRRGEDVRVYDLRPLARQTMEALHDRANGRSSMETVVGDILDVGSLRQAMQGCRRVFHLAADPNLWHADPHHFDRVNREGTEVVLRVAKELHVERVVHTSTEAVLMPRRAGGPVTEDVEVGLCDMLGPYCRSKFLAECSAFAFAKAGLPVVVVNPTTPVGPGDITATPPTRMFIDFLTRRMPAYLNARIDFVDVRDAALGHVLAAERGMPGRRHLLAGWPTELGDVLTRLARIAERPAPRLRLPYAVALSFACGEALVGRITKRPPRAPLCGVRLARRGVTFDPSWTRARLGLRPRPLDESLRDTVQWLRATGRVPS